MFALRPQRALFPNSGLDRPLSEKVRFVVMASKSLESGPFLPSVYLILILVRNVIGQRGIENNPVVFE